MKHLLHCLIALALSSCLPIQDFGSYWDKGYIDESVIGNWDISDSAAKIKKEAKTEIVHVTSKGNTFSVEFIENGKTQAEQDQLIGRTLNAGVYKYFLYGSRSEIKNAKGMLFRYVVKDNYFMIYDLKPDSLFKLLHDKYSSVTNIKKADCTSRIICEPIEITKLDEGVFKILSQIPDTLEFWTMSAASVRTK
ncbi:MAG TPA: hypothetical protein VL625_03430 [Patescibacteria group bacterium]|jgi:hypothetical protein|nr:hypothetical protein [Patescibacteria group bacterium]